MTNATDQIADAVHRYHIAGTSGIKGVKFTKEMAELAIKFMSEDAARKEQTVCTMLGYEQNDNWHGVDGKLASPKLGFLSKYPFLEVKTETISSKPSSARGYWDSKMTVAKHEKLLQLNQYVMLTCWHEDKFVIGLGAPYNAYDSIMRSKLNSKGSKQLNSCHFEAIKDRAEDALVFINYDVAKNFYNYHGEYFTSEVRKYFSCIHNPNSWYSRELNDRVRLYKDGRWSKLTEVTEELTHNY